MPGRARHPVANPARPENPVRSLWQRLLWMALLWGASVLALGVVATLFRLLMTAAGLKAH
ncbi:MULTISPECIES: DUF2474 domain-containing protein [Dickeya]|uniref:DUF2474 domain-containing protein n=1 Tax=Dickeya TaxID=204037 RepID=UPI00039C7CC7|nr:MULTISPECIES: DUF2474 domain-containing protein [Dickeya]